MKGIKGQLDSLPITDLMQWIDMNRKSGVLFVHGENSSKCFCFEEGKILLGSSNDASGRLGDFLAGEGHVSMERFTEAVNASREEKVPLIGYLIDSKIIPSEFLKVSIQQLAEDSIMDILSWNEGSFEFVEDLPELFSDSPILLSTNFIVFESVRKHDEVLKKLGVKEA
jgi:hypothetical protein